MARRLTTAQKSCKFCHAKPVFYNNGNSPEDFDKFCSLSELAYGGWTSLFIGANASGQIIMCACGDDFTDDYHPKFCPECGRELSTPT